MTLEEVERWFQAEMARLGTMVDADLSLNLQVEEAYMLKEHLLTGAKEALKYEEDIALFESWHPTTPLKRLQSELSELFSGKKLNQEMLKKITALDDVERVFMREDGFKVTRRTDLEMTGFYGETEIIVENGEYQEIQYIGEGQMVLSRCEKTGEMAYRKVIRNIYREDVPNYIVWTDGINEEGNYYESADRASPTGRTLGAGVAVLLLAGSVLGVPATPTGRDRGRHRARTPAASDADRG